MANQRLMDEVRGVMRRLHYSIHTERSYCDWIFQFVRFHRMQSREALLRAGNRLAPPLLFLPDNRDGCQFMVDP